MNPPFDPTTVQEPQLMTSNTQEMSSNQVVTRSQHQHLSQPPPENPRQKSTRKRNPRQCLSPGCTKCSQGSTKYCIAHGGGRRCTFHGCVKAARDKQFCAAHGGGRRCTFQDCKKAAVGGSYVCTSHGGGKKCAVPGCEKSAQSPTPFCVRHGGGKTCKREGCRKVARGRSEFCAGHGGGSVCRFPECQNVAVSNHIFCREHRRQLKKIGLNVLKEGKTYYLSSLNSPFPLLPFEEALQYLKSSIQNGSQTFPPELGVGHASPSSSIPNGYIPHPISMIPIHTQSVLYPTMQYFPPLTAAALPRTLFESPPNYDGDLHMNMYPPVNTNPNPTPNDINNNNNHNNNHYNNEYDHDDDEDDESDLIDDNDDDDDDESDVNSGPNSTTPPNFYQFPQPPLQCYPISSHGGGGLPLMPATSSSNHLLNVNMSTTPLPIAVTPAPTETGTQTGLMLLRDHMGLKRTREDFENGLNQTEPFTSPLLPSLLPTFPNGLV